MGEDKESRKEIEELVHFVPIWDAEQNQHSTVVGCILCCCLTMCRIGLKKWPMVFYPSLMSCIHWQYHPLLAYMDWFIISHGISGPWGPHPVDEGEPVKGCPHLHNQMRLRNLLVTMDVYSFGPLLLTRNHSWLGHWHCCKLVLLHTGDLNSAGAAALVQVSCHRF